MHCEIQSANQPSLTHKHNCPHLKTHLPPPTYRHNNYIKLVEHHLPSQIQTPTQYPPKLTNRHTSTEHHTTLTHTILQVYAIEIISPRNLPPLNDEFFVQLFWKKDMDASQNTNFSFSFVGTTFHDMLNPFIYTQYVVLAFIMLILLRTYQRHTTYHSLMTTHDRLNITHPGWDKSMVAYLAVSIGSIYLRHTGSHSHPFMVHIR